MPDFRPDIVISGINFGPNAGQDVFFSGTVARPFRRPCTDCPRWRFPTARTTEPPKRMPISPCASPRPSTGNICPVTRVYNLNLPDCPAEEIRGLKVCRHSTDWACLDSYERRFSPAGREYFWMKDPFQHFLLEDEGTDKSWLHQGWATLSPLNIDLNDEAAAKKLNENSLWESVRP